MSYVPFFTMMAIREFFMGISGMMVIHSKGIDGWIDRESRAPNKYLFKSSGIGPTMEISLARLYLTI